MASMRPVSAAQATGSSLEERLERGAIEYFPVCPFQLPEDDDRFFLRAHGDASTRSGENVPARTHIKVP